MDTLVERKHVYTYRFYMKLRIFEVMSVNFPVVRTGTSGQYAQK
jgi:hypothetical protein